jgi:PAS domain S-box-containing protein
MENVTSSSAERTAEREPDVDELRRRLAELESVSAELADVRRRLREREEELEAARTASGVFMLRERAEDKLRESEALLRQVVDLVPHFIFAKDVEGRFLLANKAVAEAYGTVPEELLGKRDADFNPSKDEIEHFRSDDLEVIESGRPKVISEETITDADGAVRWLQTIKIPFTFPNSDKPSMLGVAIDISELKRGENERRRLEAQVQHAQKLESLGVLAGGIAHDFNNLLGGILGNLGLSLARLPAGSPHRAYVVEADKAARRAADLASQMLAYSGKGNFVVEVVDLNQLVDDMLHLLEASVSKKARLELRLAEPPPLVEGDPTQIRQVVMNLVTNASDALGDYGGDVVAETGVMDADRDYLRHSYLDDRLPAGRYAFLSISDSGAGMTPETRSRIFDPFFTTKSTGRGLGMAVVLGIVRGHRGAIRVDTQLGAGSTFRVLFPACERPSETDVEAAAAEAPPQGAGVILVVDDEEMIRFVAGESLRLAGFGVLTATDGYHAIEVFRQHADEIAAVLLDMSMPRLDGIETFQQLRRQRPDVKVVFSSGYNEQEAIHHLGDAQRVGFIKKPYLPTDLVQKVREALES